ncbi:hypothetical protein MBM_00461 [Drepanopeziza brunnea f. sp. 'multigermtubi' MB_m1]|uniref:Uncharacterized protein n=1 Tax=Marssonina brunnea f. sp. multigermtubi (strain MB_m1) TaxID=1072389 RepID=K1XL90_MARBU|nr:uncharacterized protein MBM_00461 [Drepanopeziza brunnea f. sp. 'multigermtubi' MB_m1]EKD21348.1 hypothetical protein MBM_00461 [Drepanopeziza brunnea f. sp. 'multigermtubi' MB_m1]
MQQTIPCVSISRSGSREVDAYGSTRSRSLKAAGDIQLGLDASRTTRFPTQDGDGTVAECSHDIPTTSGLCTHQIATRRAHSRYKVAVHAKTNQAVSGVPGGPIKVQPPLRNTRYSRAKRFRGAAINIKKNERYQVVYDHDRQISSAQYNLSIPARFLNSRYLTPSLHVSLDQGHHLAVKAAPREQHQHSSERNYPHERQSHRSALSHPPTTTPPNSLVTKSPSRIQDAAIRADCPPGPFLACRLYYPGNLILLYLRAPSVGIVDASGADMYMYK